ncbi:MAG: hypothetical protein KDD69_09650 [Bdellovibrionales bacterium]|nr:hypothetical protein [Bdellovibrionales bacterium]
MWSAMHYGLKILLLALLFFPRHAYAYFDPGTGALLVQALVGLLATFCLFFRRIMVGLRAFFSGTKSADSSLSTSEPEKQDRQSS